MTNKTDAVAKRILSEVGRAAMARMLNLRNVLGLVNYGLHDGTFAKQESVHQWHQPIFHIGANACDQLDIEGAQQFFQQLFANIAFICEEFAKEFPNQVWHRFSVVHVTRREHQIEQFASLIENQVQFEAKEPAGRGLATLCQP